MTGASGPDLVAFQIDRLGAAGDGLATAADGRTVFLPFTLPGETIRARPGAPRGAALTAQPEIIDTPSPDRIPPACVHFGTCGGCALQHWAAAPYQAWKAAQLRAALIRAGFADPPVGPTLSVAPGARMRMDLALRRTGGQVRLGLHRARATEVIDLAECPVLHPELVALLAPLRALVRGLAALRREGTVVANRLDHGIDLLLGTDAPLTLADRRRLAGFAETAALVRLSWARAGADPEPVAARLPPVLTVAGVPVRPPPGAFLQAAATETIQQAVLAAFPAALPRKARIVELFAGIGTLSFALARLAPVAAFEADAAAVAALRQAAGAAGL
ncbi:MAG: class I SAM-dependent RNA methyltransferase, partial [Acetobacteraceae bacterium]